MIERMFVVYVEGIPRCLDDLEPGPVLAGFLACIDVTEVSGHDRIVVLRAHQRMAAHYQAQMYQDMVSVVDVMEDSDDPMLGFEAAATEIRAALRLTRRAADAVLETAMALRLRLPRLWELLAAGVIDERRARVIAHGVAHLPEEIARRVVEEIADEAPRLTTGQLRARLRRLCIETDPAEAQRRYEETVSERRVVAEPTDDGTAHLFGLDLPPDRVAAITARINALARSLRGGDETRTMDQLRADVFLDLLDGTAHHGRGGVIDLQVDLATLAGLAEAPGELGGFGPVIADIARQATDHHTGSEWRYTVTDRGQALHHGTTRRRPTAAQRRHVQTRDRTCVFPGCRMPAVACDIDHTTPWAEGGPTSVANTAPACRHDHINKDRGWTYQRLPDGDYHWTSPLGHTHTTSGHPP